MQSTMIDLLAIVDCMIYYTDGNVCAKHPKISTCSLCKNAFINTADLVNNIESSVKMSRPDTRLTKAGKLVQPNSAIFYIFRKLKELFSKFR